MTLGGKAQAEAKPVYGASLGFRKGGETVSQSFKTPAAKVAEFNFSGGKVQDARIGTMNFATREAVTPTGDRLNFDGVSGMTWLWIGLGVAVIWYVVDQNNNGSNSGY